MHELESEVVLFALFALALTLLVGAAVAVNSYRRSKRLAKRLYEVEQETRQLIWRARCARAIAVRRRARHRPPDQARARPHLPREVGQTNRLRHLRDSGEPIRRRLAHADVDGLGSDLVQAEDCAGACG